VSDVLTFTTDISKNYLVIFDFNASATSFMRRETRVSGTGFQKAAAATYNQQTVTGFTTDAYLYAVSTLLVRA
jgi:hypothetical protein